MYKIAIINPYFGSWPPWIDHFFYSCIKNPTIDFYFFTDCGIPEIAKNSSNIHFTEMTFEEYSNFVSSILNIEFHPTNAYKLCDLKPFYGIIHKDLLFNYDFWGFGDVDLIWGDIRSFYTDHILSYYNIISTHSDRISGHLCLIRNRSRYNRLAYNISNWKIKLESNNHYALDEIDLTLTIYKPAKLLWKIHKWIFFKLYQKLKIDDEWTPYNKFCQIFNKLFRLPQKKIRFIEQDTTPYVSSKTSSNIINENKFKYIYKNGKIYRFGTMEELIYLHFLSLKNIWNLETIDAKATPPLEISLKGIHSYSK